MLAVSNASHCLKFSSLNGWHICRKIIIDRLHLVRTTINQPQPVALCPQRSLQLPYNRSAAHSHSAIANRDSDRIISVNVEYILQY